MKILGINSAYHETAAALIVDGQVHCAVEEERFNRYKHGTQARIDNPDEMPVQAIRYCLEQGNLCGEDLDAVSFSFDLALRQKMWQPDPYGQPGDWGHPEGEQIFQSGLARVPDIISEILNTDILARFHWVPHHLAHAASTYYPAGFDEANILVADGIGEHATTLLGYGTGTQIKECQHFFLPNSLGFLWEKISKFLGFSEYDAAKVMGLAGYGNSQTYKKEFSQIISYDSNGNFQINNDIIQFRQPHFERLMTLFGPIENNGGAGSSQKSQDIAATLQIITNEIMLGLAKHLYNIHPCQALCLAGGVALNCQANWVIKEQGPYEHIYIPSAPHDGGIAIGAGLYTYYNTLSLKAAQTQALAKTTKTVMPHPYTGPAFDDETIYEFLQAQNIDFRHSTNVAKEAAQFVFEGKIVGWFQGGLEFGPRALGNRSLLADPRDYQMRETLNYKVKHREPFRPFSPSVLEEEAHNWFELGKPSESYRYMLFACPAKKDKAKQIPAVLHIDGTGRVQTVNKQINPKYHALISHFATLSGVPMVLNTSFNDSEPIVCTPQDAFNTFCKTKIDVLILGNYIIER